MTRTAGSHASALALNGGQPVRTAPWPTRTLFGEAEKQAVVSLFDRAAVEGSHVLGYNGPEEAGYCEAFVQLLGGGFADAVNSGTNAVYVALRALDIEPGGEVIVPPVSDAGGVMPVALMNCVPVAADAAPGSYNMGAEQIAARITPRTRAIIVAHIAGIPADMDPIMELARKHNLPVLEDCAQAHGARYKGRPVGTIGDIASFSTMFGKHHATGGQGGVVFTRSEELYWRVRRYADRGKPFGVEGASGNVVASLNFNMDELHAAIGRVQIARLPEMVRRRRATAQAIDKGCRETLRSVRLVTEAQGDESVYWFLLFDFDADKLRIDKEAFVEALTAEGIAGVGPTYLVVPTRMDWCRNRRAFGAKSDLPWSQVPDQIGDAAATDLPNIEATDARHFRMMLHEDWTQQEVDDLIAAMAKVEAAYLAE